MKEIYYLNQESLPTIPVPHDCTIKTIRIENQDIAFVFDDDISNYDTIARIQPQAKSLVIRYHFTDSVRDYSIYNWVKPNSLNKNGCYQCLANCLTNGNHETLLTLTDSTLEFLDHYVSEYGRSILIKMFSSSKREILLEADVDRIEFEWIV